MNRIASSRVLIGGIFIVGALIVGLVIGAAMIKGPAPASTQAPKAAAPAALASSTPPVAAPLSLALANLTRSNDETFFFIDSVYDVSLLTPPPTPIKVKSGAPITMTGWAVDNADGGNVAGGVILSVDDAMAFPVDYGVDRPDVAATLKNPLTRKVGFSVVIPPNTLGAGRHTLAIKIVTTDRKSYYAPSQKIDIEIA